MKRLHKGGGGGGGEIQVYRNFGNDCCFVSRVLLYSDLIQKESGPVDHNTKSNVTQSKTQPNLPMDGQCLKMFKNIKNERVIVYFSFFFKVPLYPCRHWRWQDSTLREICRARNKVLFINEPQLNYHIWLLSKVKVKFQTNYIIWRC